MIGPWRTAYQEVRLRIGPLAKLGRLKSSAENFLVFFVTISLASGPSEVLPPGTLKFSMIGPNPGCNPIKEILS